MPDKKDLVTRQEVGEIAKQILSSVNKDVNNQIKTIKAVSYAALSLSVIAVIISII